MAINLPSSKPQAIVAASLEQMRKLFLREALANAIQSLDLTSINAELDEFAPAADLKALASANLRGESVFAVPLLLRTKPNLLGYYRLWLGFSQKEFYSKAGLGRFKVMELEAKISPHLSDELPDLSRALNSRASELLHEIGLEKLSRDLLHDLALLTLGPQLRGGNNTRIGKLANRAVFELIQQIAGPSVIAATATTLELRNAAGRPVLITFSADPDISIREEIAPSRFRDVVAIEIKGGTDKSNIWNRLGEAEKSHQSAKQRGFVQFWTIYNVETLDLQKAREKSPTSQRFYSLRELSWATSEQFVDFRDQLLALIGLASADSGQAQAQS